MGIYIDPTIEGLAQTTSSQTGLLPDVILAQWNLEEGVGSVDTWPGNNPAGMRPGNPQVDALSNGINANNFLTFATPALGAQAYGVLYNTDPDYAGVRATYDTNNANAQLTAIAASPWDGSGHYGGNGYLLFTSYSAITGSAIPDLPVPNPTVSTSTSGGSASGSLFKRSDALALGYIIKSYLNQPLSNPGGGSSSGGSGGGSGGGGGGTSSASWPWGFEFGVSLRATPGGTGAGGGIFGDLGKAAPPVFFPLSNVIDEVGDGGGFELGGYGAVGTGLGVFNGGFGFGGGNTVESYIAHFGEQLFYPVSSGGGGGWYGGGSGGNGGGGGGGSGFVLTASNASQYPNVPNANGDYVPYTPPSEFYCVGGLSLQMGVNQNDGYCIINGLMFKYTGYVQTYTTAQDGDYFIECWGAQGGGLPGTGKYSGGLGGYASGIFSLPALTTLYIFVGNSGASLNQFNGGGPGLNNCYAGGGATDVRFQIGMDTSGSDSLEYRFIVAGGGGGVPFYATVGALLGSGGWLPSPDIEAVTPTGEANVTNPGGDSVSTSSDYYLTNDLSVATVALMYGTTYSLPTKPQITISLIVNGVVEASTSITPSAGGGSATVTFPFSTFTPANSPATWKQVTIEISSNLPYVQIPPRGLVLTIVSSLRATDNSSQPKPVLAQSFVARGREQVGILDLCNVTLANSASSPSDLIDNLVAEDLFSLRSVYQPNLSTLTTEVVLVTDTVTLPFANSTPSTYSGLDQISAGDNYTLVVQASTISSVPEVDQLVADDISSVSVVAVTSSTESEVDQLAADDISSVSLVAVTSTNLPGVDQLAVDDVTSVTSTPVVFVGLPEVDQLVATDISSVVLTNSTFVSLPEVDALTVADSSTVFLEVHVEESEVDAVVVDDTSNLSVLVVTPVPVTSADQLAVDDTVTLVSGYPGGVDVVVLDDISSVNLLVVTPVSEPEVDQVAVDDISSTTVLVVTPVSEPEVDQVAVDDTSSTTVFAVTVVSEPEVDQVAVDDTSSTTVLVVTPVNEPETDQVAIDDVSDVITN